MLPTVKLRRPDSESDAVPEPWSSKLGPVRTEESVICEAVTLPPRRQLPYEFELRESEGIHFIFRSEYPIEMLLTLGPTPICTGKSRTTSSVCWHLDMIRQLPGAEVSCIVVDGSILVTGAAGQVGSVGRTLTGLLLDRGFPVRVMVRREDERAASLRAAGAQVMEGDLLEPGDVYRAVTGCGRAYFGMSVSTGYLEVAVTMMAVARKTRVSALVNMSQITVSEMSLQNTTLSHQQRQHWLSEQALAWSGVPVVTIRATMSLESFFN